jgi:translation initiation factor 1
MKNDKNKISDGQIIFSTNREFKNEEEKSAEEITLPPEKQNLSIRLETKGRGGKSATIITGFIGTENDLKDLEKLLKARCGSGGSSKDGEILIQGDFKEKIYQFLFEKKYKIKKSGG